ncbi:MAG: type II secretion system F family protein [Anaerolineae bacterium]|nr:type II secretion system F family protein [Anaerolineae bacterium]
MDQNTITIIAIVGGVLALGVLLYGVYSVRRQNRDVIEERLGRYTEYDSYIEIPDYEDEAGSDEPSALTTRLDGMLMQRGFGQRWKVSLAKADLKLTVAEYFSVHVIAVIGFFAAAMFVLFPGDAVMSIVAGVVGFFAPRIYVSRKQKKRLKDFETQLPDTIGLWVNGLRSGYSVLQAMEAIGTEAPEPTATEFRRVVQEVQLGVSMEDALDHMLSRVDSEDLDLIVTAVNIQREVGGNLAEILDVIGHTIRERIKLKGEIRVLTSQGRATGAIISGLPIALALFLMLVNPNYMGGLFENRMCGWPMIGIGLGLIGTGAAIIQRIVDIDY